MKLEPLPFDSGVPQYEQQANALLEALRAGDSDAIKCFKRHPRFQDENIPWRHKNVSNAEVQSANLDLSDAQLALAHWYDFLDWSALIQYAQAACQKSSTRWLFEAGVEAVIHGNVPALDALLQQHPALIAARSARKTSKDPPVHAATLLHYIAANGVEDYRQKTPKNAVEIAKLLLRAGAEVDALAKMYGGECTTMSMLVSSCHPDEAGVQVALAETLIDFGASLEPRGAGHWISPLITALAFGYSETAQMLARRGAPVDNIAAAAGLGRLAEVRQFLPAADTGSRHRALALAAQHGHEEVVRMLLDAGEDPSRYNPQGAHAESTPLHQAVWADRDAVVRLLVERGADLSIKDKAYQGTPLDWAIHAGKTATADYLRAKGAKTGS